MPESPLRIAQNVQTQQKCKWEELKLLNKKQDEEIAELLRITNCFQEIGKMLERHQQEVDKFVLSVIPSQGLSDG